VLSTTDDSVEAVRDTLKTILFDLEALRLPVEDRLILTRLVELKGPEFVIECYEKTCQLVPKIHRRAGRKGVPERAIPTPGRIFLTVVNKKERLKLINDFD
jgi:hypothetical protein